ncbi:MAG: glycoside hydrolase family 32 protein [Saprospiraceae bacterium]|nr:glycoside hydrolase family 32 protein [Saprospiraceae bacterium]
MIRHLIFLYIAISLFGCMNGSETETKQGVNAVVSYQEAHRPQYHFTPEKMWMNDPNGMVYYEGEYHLFYQYYPDSTVWGPMHWGHAISKDLIHWEHLPIALYPDSLGYIFSGGAVIDWKNTSGLGTPSQPPMVAFFTYHNAEIAKAGGIEVESQAIAYSLDKGRSWTKFPGNPVIKNPGIKDFRDPNVIWHEGSNQWVLVLAASDRLHIYNSPNLRDWNLASEFGEKDGNHDGVWECPDLFPLQIDGQEKWVLLQNISPGHPNGGSGTQYFIGDFDGKVFKNDNPPAMSLWLDYGKDNYAGVTWSDAPNKGGQRTFIGWMSNWQYAQQVPTAPAECHDITADASTGLV